MTLMLFCVVLLSASAALAQTAADHELRTRWLALHKLAVDVKELNRCTGIVSVEDSAAFEPIAKAYHRKADELAKAVEDFVTRFADRRAKHETIFAFRYRTWDSTLQAAAEKARPASALNRDLCSALAR